MIEQRVTLRYGAQQIPAIVQAVQGDTGRDVIFELADYEIPAGATANYYIDKPDGNAVYNSAEVISSTEILAHLTEQALAAPGRNNGQVRILSDGEVITSFDFVLEVEVFRGILHMQSETEVNIFDQAIEDAATEAISDAVEEIQAQTPVVTGMQNSIAPTYSSSSTYSVGDYVMHNAQLYRCITEITTAEAWTAAHWIQVPLSGDVNQVEKRLDITTGAVKITEWTNGGYIYTGKSVGDVIDISTIVAASAYQCVVIQCNSNDQLIISGLAGSAPRLWAFLDADNKLLICSPANETAENLTLYPPIGTAKVVLNRNVSNVPCYIGIMPIMTSNTLLTLLDYPHNKESYIENLFDKDAAIEGGYYNSHNTWVENSLLYSSDLIPCKIGDVFSINYLQDILLYDINKNFIKAIGTYQTNTRHAFIIPETEKPAYYFRSYGLMSQKDTDAIFNTETYIGSSVSMPYGEKYVINSKTIGKIIHAFGDSRTWYDLHNYYPETLDYGTVCIGYLTWMRRYLSTAVFNNGASGYTTPQILNVVINTDISNADIITLAGGINDFLHSVDIGELQPIGGDFDTSTVYGALQSIVEYIIGVKPSAKLMLINPFVGWINNDLDEFPETYAKIKRDVASLYRLPLLDLTKKCGFNVLNRDTFFTDDMTEVSYRLHLNDAGNALIGQMVASFVSNGF